MDLIDDDNIESFDNLQNIIDEADEITLNLLPSKSKVKYVKKIDKKKMCEQVMLVYMKQMLDTEKIKPPTMWSRFSMLKSTLLAYENINMKPWEKVNSFMKKLAKGYCPKKAMTFTAEDITKFCANAPDNKHLADKVSLNVTQIRIKQTKTKVIYLYFFLNNERIFVGYADFRNGWWITTRGNLQYHHK